MTEYDPILMNMSDRELVDIILFWMPSAPKSFKPKFTKIMDTIVSDGNALKPGHRHGLINVIQGYKISY